MNDYRIPAQPAAQSRSAASASDGRPQVVNLFNRSIHQNRIPAWETNYPAPCVILYDESRQSFVVLDKETLAYGTLLIGGIGSGKTTVLREILRQLLARLVRGESMLIFDTKGDYASLFYQPDNPMHVLIGSPDTYPTATLWNLFAEIGPLETLGSEATRRAEGVKIRSLAQQLFVGRENEQQPFFTQTAADLFAKGVTHLIRQSRRTGNRNLLCNSALRQFFRSTDAQGWKTVLTQDNPDFSSSAVYFGGTRGDMGASILATLNSMVEDLFSGFFGDGGPQDTFSIRDAVENGRIVFIEYDLSIAEVLCPVYRLLFDRAIKTRTARTCRSSGNLYLICDELKLLPRLHLDDAVNLCRDLGDKKGVRVFAACQNIHQIIEQFGESGAKSLLGGFGTCIAFSNPDSHTRNYLSERYGKLYQSIVYEPLRTPVPVCREGHVLEDFDILDLRKGQAAVKLPFHDPFIFQFADYPS
ncbi:MAG: type IV secretion system DNA-binding domain-containing protein [Clostridia bacterium]|nr:type IV secretion system DNA-binding domain-containing protein [Clostridia bacterium]